MVSIMNIVLSLMSCATCKDLTIPDGEQKSTKQLLLLDLKCIILIHLPTKQGNQLQDLSRKGPCASSVALYEELPCHLPSQQAISHVETNKIKM